MFDEEDGCAFLVQTVQDGEHFLHEFRGQSHGGFVEDEDLGIAHPRAGQGEHLLLPPAEGAGELPRAFAQAGENIHNHLEVACSAGFVAPDPSAELQVLHHGQSAEDAAPLRNVGETEAEDAVGGHPAHVAPLENDRTLERQHAGDRAEGSGLACAVGPDEGEDFALLHVEADVFDRADIAVADHEIFHPEDGFTHGRPPVRGRPR